METLKELEVKTTQLKQTTEVGKTSENKLSYEARKEQSKKVKKAEREVEQMELSIQNIEKELADMNEKLQLPTYAADSEFIIQYQKKQRELEHKMYEWELLNEELEELKAAI